MTQRSGQGRACAIALACAVSFGTWQSGVSAAGSYGERPRTGQATDVVFVHVEGLRGGNRLEIRCHPTEPSWGHMTASYIRRQENPTETAVPGAIIGDPGHVEWGTFFPLTVPGANDGVWLNGEQVHSDSTGSRTFYYGADGRYFTGYSATTAGPSEPWERYFALASFGGELGECTATSDGQVSQVRRLAGTSARYVDLGGGDQNPLWAESGDYQAGGGYTYEAPLEGGTALIKVDNGYDGYVQTLVTNDEPALRMLANCHLYNNDQGCHYGARFGTELRVTVGSATTLKARYTTEYGDYHEAAPLLYYFDLPGASVVR